MSVFDYSKVKNMSTFKWSPEGLKYLWVFVDSNLKNLFKLNFVMLFLKNI